MFDNKLLLASAQTVTASAIGDEVVDLDTANAYVAEGRPLYVYVYMTTAFSATTETVAIELYEGTSATVDTEVMELQPAVDANAAPFDATGLVLKVPLPINKITKRYIGIHFTASDTIAAGTFDAFLAP